uniref:Uncharacterized protein n=1 Tax=Rhizophora mucronata TaxID=61149 RepID=A0A2P2KDR9_RHIMU
MRCSLRWPSLSKGCGDCAKLFSNRAFVTFVAFKLQIIGEHHYVAIFISAYIGTRR